MIRRNSSPTSVPGESAVSQVGDSFSSPEAGCGSRPLKPFTTASAQLAHLRLRGLDIQHDPRARAVLKKIGYYRFSGYAHCLKSTHSLPGGSMRFQPDVCFDQVVEVAEFDKALRLLLLQGLETIEIAVRSAVVDRLGRLDVEAHRKPHLFDRRFTAWTSGSGVSPHAEWLQRFDALCAKSKEDFVEHHRRHYGGRLPVWAAVEVLDFGLLSKLIEGLQFRDAKALAEHFALGHPVILKSWMHMFNVARNRAAHHARLWNRTTSKIPLLPTKDASPDLDFLHGDEHAKTRLFGTLSCMRAMIRTIAPQDGWHREVIALMDAFPRFRHLGLRSAGFPDDWKRLRLWRA